MRMRHKKNLIPRMERCASLQIKNPEEYRGQWRKNTGYSQIQAEFGCGKGRFTVETAKNNPEILLVAVEKVPDAMVIAMERAFNAELTNIKFLDMDVANLKEIFCPGELSVIYINFPDPWPRQKEIKRRLTAPSFLDLYREILKPGGRIEYKTDQLGLFEYTLTELAAAGFEITESTTNLHTNGPVGIMTDYEAKFYEQGIKICRCVARKPL